MQEAYEKSNGSFSIEIVEEIDADKDKLFLSSREEYYINMLHPTLNGEHASCGMTEKDRQRCEQNKNGYGAKYLSPIRPDLLPGSTSVKSYQEYKIRIDQASDLKLFEFLQGKEALKVFKAALREYMANHQEEE